MLISFGEIMLITLANDYDWDQWRIEQVDCSFCFNDTSVYW